MNTKPLLFATGNHPSHMVMAMEHDDGLRIAQAIATSVTSPRVRKSADIWHDLAKWHLAH